MTWSLNRIVSKVLSPCAIVLMYHRVADPATDIWETTVSTDNFERHLQALKNYNVMPLKDLTDSIRHHRLRRHSIAITFDDGYQDNYTNAKPLLEKYNLPATFFITSTNTDKEKLFWWDELQQIILYTSGLPPTLSVQVNGESINHSLGRERMLDDSLRQTIDAWKACTEEPPTLRCRLFYELWQLLKPLREQDQQLVLQQLRVWANTDSNLYGKYKCMSSAQLRELAQNKLFAIGAHTVSHPALAYHPIHFQKSELEQNKRFLEQVTGTRISTASYPYGNYNHDTLAAAADLNFDAAFTTEEKPVKNNSKPYCLGRFQVKNLSQTEFKNALRQWKRIK